MNRKVFGQVNKSLTQNNRESWSLNQFQDLSQFTDPRQGMQGYLEDIFILQTEKLRLGEVKQIALSFKENTR